MTPFFLTVTLRFPYFEKEYMYLRFTTVLFASLFFVVSQDAISQVFSQQQLQNLYQQFLLEEAQQKREVDSLAALYNIPLRKEFQDGKVIELQRFENGIPSYYTTNSNVVSAATISSNKVYPGGGAGLSLTGNGVLLGVWDGGATRVAHQELNGRVSQMDAAVSLSDHATHVSGTMVATGVSTNAKGMSYEANLNAFDWNSDNSEMTTAAANGLLVSNHSYSTISGWIFDFRSDNRWVWFGDTTASIVEDRNFGFYSSSTRSWDIIARNAPNYLIVRSAGNDRGESPSAQPIDHWIFKNSQWVLTSTIRNMDGNTLGYDCISTNGNAKNILTVGAVNDIPSGYSNPNDVVMSTFSGWGPTDDGRIKPDIVANGVGLFSSSASSNTSYLTYSGTSMSSPSVSGSIGLLLQHQKNIAPTKTLLAATVKAIVIHTADESGTAPGPDYKFGWGLMNTRKAADLMTLNNTRGPSGFDIQELTLNNNDSIVIPIQTNGNQSLRATIVWTDVQGSTSANTLNPTTLRIVNDLDLRIKNTNSTFSPWILDPANPANAASTGDNFRDNVEQVFIQSPASGNYSIVIRHKGAISGGSQVVSLALSGAEPITAPNSPSLLTPIIYEKFAPRPVVHKWNKVTGASYSIQIATDTLFSNIITSGVQVDTSFTFSNALANTKYFWRVNAIVGLDPSAWTSRSYQTLIIAANNWLLKPDSISTINTLRPKFMWRKQSEAAYRVLVANNVNLNNPVINENIVDTVLTSATYLDFNRQYFWNSSGISMGPSYNPSSTWTFTTYNPILQHIVPPDASVTTVKPPLLQWMGSEGITQFNLQVSTSPTFTSNVVVNESALGDTLYSTTTLLKNKQYHWRVQPVFGPKSGTWSTPWTFSVPDNNLKKVYPDSASSIGATTLALRWKGLEGANKYSVVLANNPQFSTPIVNSTNVIDSFYIVQNLQTNTPYYWTVSATTDLGTVTSSVWTFTIVSKPELVQPADQTVNSPKLITFKWKRPGGLNATSFLQLSDKQNFSTLIEDVPGVLDTAYVYDGTGILKQNTPYFWRVKLLIGQDTTLWSDTWTLKTKQLPTISQMYPDSNANGIPTDTILYWNQSVDVEGYNVRVSTSPTYTPTIVDRSPQIDVLQTNITQLENNKKYYWQIRTRKDGEFSEWSNTWPFLTILAKPNLVQPLNEALIPPTAITLTWQTVAGSERYDLQVSKDSTFTTVIIDTMAIVPTLYEYKALEPETRYFWQVKSTSNINKGQWSGVRTFTTGSLSSVGENTLLGITVIPNPVSTSARISIATNTGERIYSIIVRNLLGMPVVTIPVENTTKDQIEFEIDATTLPQGTYYIEIGTTKRTYTSPFQIMR